MMFAEMCKDVKKATHVTFTTWLVTLWFLGMVQPLLSAVVASKQFERFPVVIRVDFGAPVTSSLCVRCQTTKYEVPFPRFVSEHNGQRELALGRILAALQQKNLDSCKDLVAEAVDGRGARQPTQIPLVVDAYNKLLAPAVAGNDLQGLDVERQLWFGNRGIFVGRIRPSAGVENAGTPISLEFENSSNGQFRWRPVAGRPDDASVLLRDVAAQRGVASSPSARTELTYTYQSTIPGSTDANPVFLEFNGRKYEFEVFGDQVASGDEVLAFYQKAYQTIKNGSPESLAEFYTASSRQKYNKWLMDRGSSYITKYYDGLIKGGRTVVFILDADPFFFVFYRKSKGGTGSLQFDDVVRDPNDGKLKLTNLNYNESIHHFLKNTKLFVDPILRPLLQGSALSDR